MSNNGSKEGLKLAIQAGTFVGLVITATALIITTISIYKTNKTMEATNSWNKYVYTIGFFEQFGKLVDSREALKDYYPDLWSHSDFTPLSQTQAAIIFGDTTESGRDKVQHIHQILNFFESVSKAYELNTADTNIVEESFGNIMMRTHKFFENYIKKVSVEWGYDAWAPFNRVANIFVEKNKAREQKKQEMNNKQ